MRYGTFQALDDEFGLIDLVIERGISLFEEVVFLEEWLD